MSEYLENMDQYSLFNFLNSFHVQQSQFLSMGFQQSSNSLSLIERQHQSKIPKKELPTTDGYVKTASHRVKVLVPSSKHHQNLIIYEPEIEDLNNLIRQGTKDDTVELNINFKTIVYNHFKQLIQANELSPHGTQLVLLFGKRTPSFKSLIQLCDQTAAGREVNKLCMQFITSSLIIRRILESRCAMGTKLQMIKFVEKLRSNIGCGRIVKWKAQAGR